MLTKNSLLTLVFVHFYTDWFLLSSTLTLDVLAKRAGVRSDPALKPCENCLLHNFEKVPRNQRSPRKMSPGVFLAYFVEVEITLTPELIFLPLPVVPAIFLKNNLN